MKALSIRQPWAWAVMAGKKKVENRDWPTLFRGRLAIHAAKYLEWVPCWRLPDGTPIPPGNELPLGALLGTVEVVDCVPLEAVQSDPFAGGPWCWILVNPQPISQPIACSEDSEGSEGLGLWTVPAAILSKWPPDDLLEIIYEENVPDG